MKKPTVVWGVDPGNESAGVSMWVDGGLRWHSTVNIWDPWGENQNQPPMLRGVRHRMFVEVPQNGTHQSRGGVHWAGGMVAMWVGGTIAAGDRLLRSHVRKVTPDTWRKPLGIDPKADTKEQAMQMVELMGLEVESHDEAEAILIGMYGCLELGLDVER